MRARAVQVMSRSLHAASRRPRRIGLPLPSSRSGHKANKNISSARAGKHQDAEQRGELKPGSELSPLAFLGVCLYLRPGGTVVEVSLRFERHYFLRLAVQATSGNTGIALAMVARRQERSAASFVEHQDF